MYVCLFFFCFSFVFRCFFVLFFLSEQNQFVLFLNIGPNPSEGEAAKMLLM